MTEVPTPRYLALKAAMMPRDANKHGTIFGGVRLSDVAVEVIDGKRQPGMVTTPLDPNSRVRPTTLPFDACAIVPT